MGRRGSGPGGRCQLEFLRRHHKRMREHNSPMFNKYRLAASRPWIRLEPDPPPPEREPYVPREPWEHGEQPLIRP